MDVDRVDRALKLLLHFNKRYSLYLFYFFFFFRLQFYRIPIFGSMPTSDIKDSLIYIFSSGRIKKQNKYEIGLYEKGVSSKETFIIKQHDMSVFESTCFYASFWILILPYSKIYIIQLYKYHNYHTYVVYSYKLTNTTKHCRNLSKILTDAEIVDCCFPAKMMSLPGGRCLLPY